MAKLFNKFQLAAELEKLIVEADEYLVLISPYFKLNDVVKEAMSKHKDNKEFHLVVVYGKNEEDKRKSLSDEDLLFFKEFENVEIRYHKRLHAKIYLNDEKCLITSMNLHDYSWKENIEVGIMTKSGVKDFARDLLHAVSGLVEKSLDAQAAEFVQYIVDKSQIEFEKKVKTKNYLFGLIKTAGDTEVVMDTRRTGYCIRTGKAIPLNRLRPFSKEAYELWAMYENPDYREKYCHECGKPSGTSMARPVCYECYKKMSNS